MVISPEVMVKLMVIDLTSIFFEVLWMAHDGVSFNGKGGNTRFEGLKP